MSSVRNLFLPNRSFFRPIPLKDLDVWSALTTFHGQEITLTAENITFRFQPLDQAHRVLQPDQCLVRIDTHDFACFLAFADLPLSAQESEPLRAKDISGVSAHLRTLLYQYSCEKLIRVVTKALDLGAHYGGLLKLADLDQHADKNALDWYSVGLSDLESGQGYSFDLAMNRDSLFSVLQNRPIQALSLWQGLSQQINLQLFHFVGSVAVTLDEVKSLKARDLLLLEGLLGDALSNPSSDPELWQILLCQNQCYQFKSVEQGWYLEEIFDLTKMNRKLGGWDRSSAMHKEKGDTMPDDTVIADENSPKKQEIYLRLTCALQASTEISINTLETWTKGTLVALDQAHKPETGAAVSLMLDDQVLADGHLIQLDDKIAVEIDQIRFK